MIVSAALIPAAPVLLEQYRSQLDPGSPWREHALAALAGALRAATTPGPSGSSVPSGPSGQAAPSEGSPGRGLTQIVVLTYASTGAITTTRAHRTSPPGLRIARMLLNCARQRDDEVGALLADVPVEEVAIAEDATTQEAHTLGLVLANLRTAPGEGQSPARTMALVVADGSACRDPKAPGHLDERAHAYDAQWIDAIANGHPAGLLDLDEHLAAELLAPGRACLQVLGAAALERTITANVIATGDPFGVAYCAAVWQCD